jgi:hypothetical protein
LRGADCGGDESECERESQMMERDEPVNWVDIPPKEFWLRGSDSSIQFIADSVLADSKQRVTIVAFKINLDLHAKSHRLQYSFRAGEISGVRNFLDELQKLLDGNQSSVEFVTEESFRLKVQPVSIGFHDRFLVSGYWSTIRDGQHSPWPSKKSRIENVLAAENSAVCIQFSFLTDGIDPGYLKQTVLQLSALIRELEDLGFSGL